MAHDAELATIFREMRRATGVSKEQIASRLATRLDTIEALENGALLALPDWPELNRIVTAYGALLGLDSRPILRRLKAQLALDDTAQTPPSMQASPPPPPAGPPMPPSASRPQVQPQSAPQPGIPPRPPGASAGQPASAAAAVPRPSPALSRASPHGTPRAENEKKSRGRMARLARGLLNWAVLVGFIAALSLGVWYASQRPRAVWSALDGLPEPVPRLMRSAWELVRPLDGGNPRPQVSDPDKRKSDKLN